VKKMALDRDARAGQPAIRTLTKQEIDQRIQNLIKEVALLRESEGGDSPESMHPRRIEPAELVRRLRRFIVYN